MAASRKILFILKRREDYSTDIPYFGYMQVATGMYNSARFVSDALVQAGFDSEVALATDANSIDALVTAAQPTHVIIEGYWVTPAKFDELKPLHPNVKWIVRCHSELPFLAQEGVAMEWSFAYFQRGIMVSGNSPRINRELQMLANGVSSGLTLPMLPNYYPVTEQVLNVRVPNGAMDIGCFGAIRPLKNQLAQAVAAYEFCKRQGLVLRFHINAGRVEMNGQSALTNLRALFAALPNAELVEHEWTDHDQFVELIASMDLLMQVSFSETFNIVAADAVNQEVPVLGSAEISWLYPIYANPTSTENMVIQLERVWRSRSTLVELNKARLTKFSQSSIATWTKFLNQPA
jgi:hypothetical protein